MTRDRRKGEPPASVPAAGKRPEREARLAAAKRPEREARLAAALRENLRKRKHQKNARKDAAAPPRRAGD